MTQDYQKHHFKQQEAGFIYKAIIVIISLLFSLVSASTFSMTANAGSRKTGFVEKSIL